MGKRWVKRWAPTHPGEKGSLVPVLHVNPKSSIEKITWRLPPSKSHAIRWLALAAQTAQVVTMHGMANAGQDVVAMRRSLGQMGVQTVDLDEEGEVLEVHSNHDDQPAQNTVAWRVHGSGPAGLHPPVSVLHAGNSGTSLRILMALASRFTVPVMLDGDASLRSRNYDAMLSSLQALGVECSRGSDKEGLPLLMKGPATSAGPLHLDVTASSQPTSAWCLATPGFSGPLDVIFEGEPVSRRHAALTMSLCEATGSSSFERGSFVPWSPTIPHGEVSIPPDCSMLAFAFLAVQSLKTTVELVERPLDEDGLGHEILFELATSLGINIQGSTLSFSGQGEALRIDLRDANDLITPLAATMALGAGGELYGASHAAFKETNRLVGTQRLLQQFGLEVSTNEGGLRIPGGQRLSAPSTPVETYNDHRMQMTALLLAAACDREVMIVGPTLHQVADPEAVERLVSAGLHVSETLHQPW
jgi:3-phosphoshikimate 1-carboxyvinyltransferase